MIKQHKVHELYGLKQHRVHVPNSMNFTCAEAQIARAKQHGMYTESINYYAMCETAQIVCANKHKKYLRHAKQMYCTKYVQKAHQTVCAKQHEMSVRRQDNGARPHGSRQIPSVSKAAFDTVRV